MFSKAILLVISLALVAITPASAIRRESARDLAGLWQAKRYFGPEVRGRLLLRGDRLGRRYRRLLATGDRFW